MKSVKPRILLTYNNKLDDGLGAQLHRIIGIFALARSYGIPYLHTGINNLLITALDDFQTIDEMIAFVQKVNEVFDFPSVVIDQQNELRRELLESPNRLHLKVFSLLKNRDMGLGKIMEVSNPFLVLNKKPELYFRATSFLPNPEIKDDGVKKIVVHFRRGSNSFDVLPGEALPRALHNEWYLRILRQFVSEYRKKKIPFQIEIFTDMPARDLIFTPIKEQQEFWRKLPRFQNNSISIPGEDLSKTVFKEFDESLNIFYGGNPLEGLMNFACADLLIMSRSSYSFVGALLNRHGRVVCPPNFWHRKLPSWTLAD